MTKKHFIALANAMRKYNSFTPEQLEILAQFLAEQNPRFDREGWLGYIAGTNGPNPPHKRVSKSNRPRYATREEQHARYIDAGPQAWDDKGESYD
jgi:hypothetical protein